MGKIIVIDGLDGSGKATQTEIVYRNLKEKGLNIKKVSFPDYESKSSTLVKMYLNGELGGLNELNPYAIATFYANDRYIKWVTELKDFYENDGIIICDRYISANLIHQGVKLKEEERKFFYDWCYDLETKKFNIPKENLTIFLLVNPAVSKELMKSRTTTDIHENNISYLNKCYENSKSIIEYCNWKTIKCDDNNRIRDIYEINKDIMDIITKNIL